MKNLFERNDDGTTGAPIPLQRPQHPVPFFVAFGIDGVNVPKPPRRLKRKGLAFLHEVASRPARHTVCRVCNKRTWTSPGGVCRKDFLAGEGGLEVSFSAE